MKPHTRNGLLFLAACIGIGGALAIGNSLPSSPSNDSMAEYAVADASDQSFSTGAGYGSYNGGNDTADESEISYVDDDDDDDDGAYELETQAALSPDSVFTLNEAGSLNCAIDGGGSVGVFWNTSTGQAHARTRSSHVLGTVEYREANAANYARHSVTIRGKDGDGFLQLSIDDDGSLSGRYDETELQGQCETLS